MILYQLLTGETAVGSPEGVIRITVQPPSPKENTLG